MIDAEQKSSSVAAALPPATSEPEAVGGNGRTGTIPISSGAKSSVLPALVSESVDPFAGRPDLSIPMTVGALDEMMRGIFDATSSLIRHQHANAITEFFCHPDIKVREVAKEIWGRLYPGGPRKEGVA